jgi:hypothetical protein
MQARMLAVLKRNIEQAGEGQPQKAASESTA